MKQITSGNLKDIIDKRNGNLWIMGHFIEPNSPFHTQNLEIKWGLHHAGESKDSPGTNTQSKTIAVLIRGKISLKFPDRNQEIILEKEGDYIYWDKGVSHSWTILEETLIITIRWPSIPGDQKNCSK